MKRSFLLFLLLAGAAPDYPEAVRLYKLAAAQGLPEAQFGLGVMYDNGQGVDQDFTEAARWYHRASDHRSLLEAQYNLGERRST